MEVPILKLDQAFINHVVVQRGKTEQTVPMQSLQSSWSVRAQAEQIQSNADNKQVQCRQNGEVQCCSGVAGCSEEGWANGVSEEGEL